MPDMYIIAGCNGAGKTTASYTVLPEMLDCKEFVNADNIASGISPFNAEKVAFGAGMIMLQRVKELITEGTNFAFETTLSTKSYVSLIENAKKKGYKVSLLFFWLNNVELAKQRVANRVKNGGHNIPNEVIERRYERGLNNFFLLFMPLSDFWMFIDNSYDELNIVAKGEQKIVQEIKNNDIWDVINKQINAA